MRHLPGWEKTFKEGCKANLELWHQEIFQEELLLPLSTKTRTIWQARVSKVEGVDKAKKF
jgi:hypothetical protein